jgi:hypothetical protein
MSKSIEIAIILLKNLSDALLSSASEIRKLENPTLPLSQTDEKANLVSMEAREFTKRENYKVGDRVMVSFKGGINPNKMRILEVLENSEYLVYHQCLSKKDSRLVTSDQILGLDPDR